jgi:hypothetical protein
VSLDTGAVHVRSDLVDEALAPLPEDIDTSNRYVHCPGSARSRSGWRWYSISSEAMPDDEERVRRMFKRRAATACSASWLPSADCGALA